MFRQAQQAVFLPASAKFFLKVFDQLIISRWKKFVVPPSGGLLCKCKHLFSLRPPEGGTTNFAD
ncbi:Uncharacterized protein dnm_094830 [Desulfonema magnum]|uniref:Uncharacterized protein n=1 Tax=Desulfonema magnum TaxID=45655 RepID=A0A975BXW9_9BACT|nr:Uncharacterized protein dnm_094830 [Desulfonema magnum]